MVIISVAMSTEMMTKFQKSLKLRNLKSLRGAECLENKMTHTSSSSDEPLFVKSTICI